MPGSTPLPRVGAPATRALHAAGIRVLEDLDGRDRAEVAALAAPRGCWALAAVACASPPRPLKAGGLALETWYSDAQKAQQRTKGTTKRYFSGGVRGGLVYRGRRGEIETILSVVPESARCPRGFFMFDDFVADGPSGRGLREASCF